MDGEDFYSVYNLRIRSEFEFPGLEHARIASTGGTNYDVWIRRDSFGTELEDEGCLLANSQEVQFHYDGVGSAAIRRGSHIIVDPSPSVDSARLKHFILGQCLGVLLHQRDLPVFHASAVAINDKAAIFLGDSGAGKSTIAAALGTAGYTILSDDVTTVRTRDSDLVVPPGVSLLKLDPEFVEEFSFSESYRSPSPYPGDRRICVRSNDGEGTPVVLSQVYVLSTGSDVRLELLHGSDVLRELIRHTYTINLLEDTDTVATNFDHCTTIANEVPVKRLCRHPDTPSIPALVETVNADFR